MSAEERLEALRRYADDGLRYYATAYHRNSSLTRDEADDLRTIMKEMTRMAHVMALIEGNEGRTAMEARGAIVERYLSETASGRVVWSPEAGITTEEELGGRSLPDTACRTRMSSSSEGYCRPCPEAWRVTAWRTSSGSRMGSVSTRVHSPNSSRTRRPDLGYRELLSASLGGPESSPGINRNGEIGSHLPSYPRHFLEGPHRRHDHR